MTEMSGSSVVGKYERGNLSHRVHGQELRCAVLHLVHIDDDLLVLGANLLEERLRRNRATHS